MTYQDSALQEAVERWFPLTVSFSVQARPDVAQVAAQLYRDPVLVYNAVIWGVSRHGAEVQSRRLFCDRWEVTVNGLVIQYDLLGPDDAMVVTVRIAPVRLGGI